MYLHNHFKQVNTSLSQTDLFEPYNKYNKPGSECNRGDSTVPIAPKPEPHY